MAIDQARTSNSSVSHQHGQCQCPSERTSRAVPRRRRSGEGRAVSHVRGRVPRLARSIPRHHGPCVPAWCRDTQMPRGTGPGLTAPDPSASSSLVRAATLDQVFGTSLSVARRLLNQSWGLLDRSGLLSTVLLCFTLALSPGNPSTSAALPV
jgi:hypothetical protein